jgi:hypothetical protein
MGLSICRSIIDAHWGRLWATGNGSEEPRFNSPCPSRKQNPPILFRRFTTMEGRAKTLHQVRLINRLPKVADDSIFQRARPDAVVGVRRHKNRRDRVSRLNEVSMQIVPGHRGHVHVSDQTDRSVETSRCEEIGGRREDLDSVA